MANVGFRSDCCTGFTVYRVIADIVDEKIVDTAHH